MKERLDVLLVERRLADSREKAKAVIMAGIVYVDGQKEDKAGSMFDVTSNIELRGSTLKYVSRGGLKLEKMLNEVQLDLQGKIAIDIGASTGGFTHCLILNGVSRVYAVDSGSNQLDESLLTDERVISMEGFNARELSVDIIGDLVDIIVCDVSFISQSYIIEVAKDLIKDDGVYIGLIKPQFEVGKGKIGKGGIVKEPKYRLEAIKKIIECAKENSLKCFAFIKSPIFGGDGNVEYVTAFTKINNKDKYEIPFAKIKELYK